MKVENNESLKQVFRTIHISILEAGYAELDQDWDTENVCNSFTRLYFPISGTACIDSNGTKVEMEPGKIYIIPSGMEFSHSCKQSMEKIYFHVSALCPNHYDVFYGLKSFLILEDSEQFTRQLLHAMKEIKKGNMNLVFLVKRILYGIVEKSMEQVTNGGNMTGPYSDLALNSFAYIESHIGADLTIREVSEALYISVSKLQKLYRKELGISVGRYIDDRIMALAERELIENRLSIKGISEKLKFCDQFYFSRKFTQRYHMSPLQYRKAMKT